MTLSSALLSFALLAAPAASAVEGPCSVVEKGARQGACVAVREARALSEQARYDDALKKLDGVEKALPEVSPHLEALRARTLLKAGRARDAHALATRLANDKVPKDPGLDERVLQVLAHSQAALGQRADAAATLTKLIALKPKDRARVRAQLVRTLLDDGRPASALPHLKKLLIEAPEHKDVKPFERMLDDGQVKLSDAELNRRLDRMLSSARYERAILEARRRGRASSDRSEASVEREVLLVTALARAHKNEEAVAHATSLVNEKDPPDAWREVHAWALGKVGELERSGLAWLALYRTATDVAQKQEACFFAGFLAYEAASHVVARDRLKTCAPVLEGSGWAPAARWYRALTWLLDGQPGKALPILDELVRTAPNDNEADKHLYWLARAKIASGDDAGGKKDLRRLATSSATSWYGLLARERLGWKPVKGVKLPADALSRHAANDDEAKRATLLHALGFTEAAQALAAGRGNTLADLALSQQLGDAHRPWRHGALFRPSPHVRKGHVVRADGWRVSYPLPYDEHVLAMCKRYDIEPALAWSIMRTESGFRPTAESVVGALGLMQLMPYTARGIANEVGLKPPLPSHLVRPRVSVELGVAVLSLSKRELGHRMLSVASYNGSPKNVAAWMRDFGHLEPELFVERIPFKETRDYVKRVLPTMALYRALDGHDLVLDIPKAPVGKPPAKVTWFPPVPVD